MHTNNPDTEATENREDADNAARQNLQRNPPGMEEVFGEVIAGYSRADAIEDGVLVDLWQPEFKGLCLEHFKVPVAMTAAVWGVVERAVENPRFSNDKAGVIHDILFMSKRGKLLDHTTRLFVVIIKGAGKRSLWTMKAVVGPGDQGEPVVTIQMPEED